MRRLWWIVGVGAVVCGCTPPQPATTQAELRAMRDEFAPLHRGVEAPAEARILYAQPGSDRWAVRRIGAASQGREGAARPGRSRAVQIDLRAAPFDEVARLLADAGRFNVVVEAPSASPVTEKLRATEPYDALVLLAEARGLAVRFEHGVVVVRTPEGASRSQP